MKSRLPSPSPEWAYFLDMDGTLIELADRPEAIQVDEGLLELICRTHECCGGALAVVSGRSLSDLDSRLGLPHLALAGQHGLERRDSLGRVHHQATLPLPRQAIMERLAPLMERHPGLLVENKGFTLAVHYRLAPRLGGYLHRLLGQMVEEAGGLQLQPGKRVVEIKPAGVDKGSAILELLSQPPFRGRKPVFIGDDLTDERGFAVVNQLEGLSIKVGPGPTVARYRLADVAAVRAWLAGTLVAGSFPEEAS